MAATAVLPVVSALQKADGANATVLGVYGCHRRRAADPLVGLPIWSQVSDLVEQRFLSSCEWVVGQFGKLRVNRIV